MFYSQFILAKKGPLGTIWIAAHLERKLRKNQVADTDIGISVDSILFPEVPIALRLSSHLLLGVVRIYCRKVNYLFDDCSEALLKIKQAFRSTAVDLPPEESTAPYYSITLPETFDLDDFELPDNDIFQGNYVDHHVSTREQITLKDTMEGAVYSTSQFGLDERFGDGDTSGLDLDEELFLDKVAAPGQAGVMLDSDADPQVSDQSMTPLKQDENHEGMTENSEDMLTTGSANQIEDPTRNIDFIEYAQAPCTPGLVEEPNLSNVQEASACDDHLESEDHDLTEFAAKENLENATSKSDLHYGNKNSLDWSLLNDMNPETVLRMPAEEYGYLLDAQEVKQLKPLADSPSTAGTMEHISSENPHLASLPLSGIADPDKAIFPVSEFSDKIIAASNDANRVEDLKKGVVSNDELGIHSIDGSHTDSVETQGVRLDETEASPGVCHEAPVLEDSYGKPRSGTEITLENSSLTTTSQPVSEDTLEINQASLQPEVSNNVEFAGNVEKSHPLINAVAINTESPDRPDLENPETQACQGPKDSNIWNPDVHEEMTSTHMDVLQPCNSHLNQLNVLNSGCDNSVVTDLPSEVVGMCLLEISGWDGGINASEASAEVQGEGYHATDVTKPAFVENHVTEPASCEKNQDDFSKYQTGNVISRDTQSERLHSSNNSEIPAPEKLLSVPEGLADLPNYLLVESTPDKAVLAGVDVGGAGIKIISGKKRSFTESTLTVQSLDSIESLGAVHSKRTGKSIPDDSDLLSSILVGRKSSVLKVKPTPPPPLEITTMKRPGSALQNSASKRKVLMDDTTVLHGDTIRQQLTSTEDIRRVRKKAPCTRPEIWVIQKQFLEDEIFSESLFTGSSTELISLHNRTYDLSEIRVSQNDENNSSLEAATDLSVGPNVTKETGMVGGIEPMVVRNDEEAEPADTPMQTENQQGDEHDQSSQGYDTVHMKAIGDLEPKSSQHELLGSAEMEIDGGSVVVPDAVNPAIVLGVEPSSSSDPVLGDIFNMSAGSVFQNVSVVLPDQKLDTQSVEMNASTKDISSGHGVDAIEVEEKNDDNVAVVGTESRARDEFLLDETEVGASVEIGADSQIDCSAYNKSTNPSLVTYPDTGGCSNQVVVTVDPALEEIQKNKQGYVNEGEVLAAQLENDYKNLTSNGIFSEEPKIDFSYPAELNTDVKNASLNDGEYLGCQEADRQNIMDTDTAVVDHTVTGDRGDFDYTIDGHDTGFLNVDNDDVTEENDDCMPSAEETHFLENSGWSSRTRAVAKYLQTLFDKEAEQGRKVLPMVNLLAGKTRKEASRMFFEALVLTTRDYIHVEQGNPFDNINIKPWVKLMKSDF